MSVHELRKWLARAPAGTMIPAAAVLELLDAGEPRGTMRDPTGPAAPAVTWRERLWTCPPETRLGVVELAEAIGRTKSWVYRHTSAKSGYRVIPHAKIDGELVFVAGAVRAWWLAYEQGIAAPETPTPAPSRVLTLPSRTNGSRR